MQVIPSSFSWGFVASDIWRNAISLVTSLSPYVLLALAVVLVLPIIWLVRDMFAMWQVYRLNREGAGDDPPEDYTVSRYVRGYFESLPLRIRLRYFD